MTRLILALAIVAAAFAAAQAQTIRRARSRSSCPTRPAGRPTRWRASSRRSSPRSSDRISSSRASAAAAPTSPASAWRARRRTATRCYIHNLQISANVSLYKTLPFDTEKDFAPIGMINSNPLVLVGKKQLAANTLPELVAWMKSSPTPPRWRIPAPARPGTSPRSCWRRRSASRSTTSPIAAPRRCCRTSLGGHLDLFFATPQQVVGQFASGAVKVFGITSKETSPQFPGVPSFVQAYGPKLEISFWHIMLAPAATPQPIVTALNGALQEAMADPEILKIWANSGMAPYPPAQRTPEGAAAYLKQQIAHWGEVVRDNKIEAPTQLTTDGAAMANRPSNGRWSIAEGASETASILDAGLDALDFGFAIFDRNLKLVASNKAFADLRGYPAALCKPGTDIIEFYRFNAERGDYGPGDAEAQAMSRMERVREGQPHELEYELADRPDPQHPLCADPRRRARAVLFGHHRAQARGTRRRAQGSAAPCRARQHAGMSRLHRREPEHRVLQPQLHRDVSGAEGVLQAGAAVSRSAALPGGERLLRRRRSARRILPAASKACAIPSAIRWRTARRTAGSTRSTAARSPRAARSP